MSNRHHNHEFRCGLIVASLLCAGFLYVQPCAATGSVGSENLPEPTFHWDPRSESNGHQPVGEKYPYVPNYHHQNGYPQGAQNQSHGYGTFFGTKDAIRAQIEQQKYLETGSPIGWSHRYSSDPVNMFQGRHRVHYGRHNSIMRNYYPAISTQDSQYQYSQANWHRQRSSALDSSARELQRELSEEPNYQKGIKLVPQGTNLYVRNYETFHSATDDRNNAIPLIATPQRLDDVLKSSEHPGDKSH